jgi:urate oxidase
MHRDNFTFTYTSDSKALRIGDIYVKSKNFPAHIFNSSASKLFQMRMYLMTEHILTSEPL